MKSLAIVVLLAAGVLSIPRGSYSERSDCRDLGRLNSHATTIFDYVGETRNTIKGSTSDNTGILVKVRIYIHPLKACQFSMQINEVELLTKSKNQNDFVIARESRKFSRDLQAQDLTFKVSNGKITKLLPSSAESIHILNIKRGILSTLQLSKPSTTEEIDVNGLCKVKIEEKYGEIVKSKNISECSQRALNEVGYQTTSFEKTDLPINPLNSTSVCKYTVYYNRIRSVDCLETHIFRPFSAGYESPAGVITTIKQKLIYKGEKYSHKSSFKENLVTESDLERTSLIYQHKKEETKPDRSIVYRFHRIMNNLVGYSRVNNLAAKQSSAHDFTTLVGLLRKLNRKTMVPVWERYFDCERSRLCNVGDASKDVYRQYLLDGLTYCGTETCVYTVHNVIIDGKVGRETMDTFLQAIALAAKPTKAMIRDVLNIAQKKPSRQSFLTLGTLMYRYCSTNTAGCAYDYRNPITKAEFFLEDKLGKDCGGQKNGEHVEEILMALKAIGNAGRPIRAWQTLLNCAEKSIHQNISVAALDSLRRMPCKQGIQYALHKRHENIDMDPETRIHVYLALMKCPTENTLRRVVEQLGKEKSRQVGSFMASHLKNLNESSDPRHKKTKEFLSTILKMDSIENFNLDLTKYSRAFEGSVHSSWLKSGASFESHLIFTPNSYIPRSALLNMTATILNVPVNILEMAARVEGLETLLEDLFGADGYFPDNNILKMFNITFTKDDIAKLRTRRNVKDDILDENIAELHEKTKKKRVRPSGNLNIKVFGNEMSVLSYDDIFWAVDQIDNMNVIELLLQVAKGGQKTFTKSMLFLEMTHTVPTCLGLPLKLKLTGSTVASLELNGKVDIRNMFWGPSSMEIKGYIMPSAVVELAGQMGIHSHYVDSGIFVNSSMFTSQKLKGAVIYKEGQTLQVNLDAPEEPNQLFNFSSTSFLFLNEEATLVEGAPRRITPDFCINSNMVLGLGLCTRLSLPVAFKEYEAPYFPLSGSSSFGMSLVKSDPKLTTYQLSIKMKKNRVAKNELSGWFEMGTPGATYSRHLAGIIKFVKTSTSRMLTIGSFGEDIRSKIEFMINYQTDTNRFEMDLRSNLYTTKTIKMKFLYFNDAHILGRQTGVHLSAEYDWYKFEHLVKFVKKTTSYLLHSRTTYWPEKQMTSEIEFVPSRKSISLKLNANQMKQSIEILGKYTKTNTEKGLKFTIIHPSRKTKTTFYVGILNERSAKKFIINGTTLGEKAELTWGYYVREMIREVRFNANIAGKSMALFAVYNKITDSWLTTTIGGIVGKNKIGISTEYVKEDDSFDRKLCSFIFYNDQQPLKTCLALKKVPETWAKREYKRLSWTTTILNRYGAITFDYQNNNGKYGLTATATYDNGIIFTNNWEVMYDSIWNTQLKMTMTAGRKTVSVMWFSTMFKENLRTFGVEARGFNKMLKLMTTYSKETKEDAVIHDVICEAWVNKKLPVKFNINLELGKTIKGLSTIFKIKSYMVKHSLFWIQPEANKYFWVVDFVIAKENFVIFRNKLTDILEWTSAQKGYKQMCELIIWNKKFQYGWDVTYQHRSTVSKILNFGLSYARNRRSSIRATLNNNYYNIELLIDVEYLPRRYVSNVIRYQKDAKQLDVILEFLPKMFVKLMGRLDKVDGWKIRVSFGKEFLNRLENLKHLIINTSENLPDIMEQTRKVSIKALDIAKNIYTATKNMKSSGEPVVMSAIKLVKEIRIRGKTVEQIIKQVPDMVKNNAENIAEYIKEIPVPYRSETFAEMYDKTVADLLTKTEDFNWEKTGKKIMIDIKTDAKLFYKRMSGLFLHYKDLADNWYVNNKEKNLKMLFLDTKAILIKIIETEITDEKTKKAAKNVLELSKNYLDKVLDLLKDNYRKLRTLLKNEFKTFGNNKWNWLNEKRNTFSLYPITNHEIWGELKDELLNHDMVSELKALALKGKQLALEYKHKLIDYTDVDKMTLDDVVTKIKELETSVKNKKDVMVQKFRKTYEVEITKFLTYYNKAKAIGDKYIREAKILWNNNYPKLVEKATLTWKLAMVKAEELKKKYTKLAKEIKEKYTEKVLEPWNDSELKQKLDTFKRMTIRKVIEEIMKLPKTTKTMTRNLYKKAVTEVKSNFEKHLLPYVHLVKNNVVIIFNEINDTAEFICKYYNLNDNFMSTMKTYIESYMIKMKTYIASYMIKMKTYIPDFKKYVILDTSKGELVLSIPYYKSIETYFTYYITKVADQIDYYKKVIHNAKTLVLPYYKATDRFAKNCYQDMELQYYKISNKAKLYFPIVKTAITDWWSGTDLRTAFRIIELELENTYKIMKADFQLNKAPFDRAIRIAKIIVGRYWRTPIEVMNPYRSVAMIFGKTHVVTFDNKYYDVPTYSKPHCTYLLARDFQRGNFTILTQKEHLIVRTPDMRVKIHMNGKLDIPVQSDIGFCKRMGYFITCEFKQGLRIRCDTGHFLCTIELSGWHYSKSQGLLGTNNHEVYDDIKLPDGTITDSMTKFVNAWEVSGDRRCLVNEWYSKVPYCYKAPSEQCFKILKEDTSPYSLLFGVVDPMPFLKACQIDSADCETKEPYETSHCNSTAAYVEMLRLKGVWVPLPKDCRFEARRDY